MAHSGRPGTVATLLFGDARVGVIAFHTERNSNFLNDHQSAAALVQTVSDVHDLTIVSFHGGAEGPHALHVPDESELYYGEDRGHLRAFAQHVVEAGADLVLGHGPRVPRGLQLIDGRLVAYSLGGFATYGRFDLTGVLGTTLVLEVVLNHEGKFVRGKVIPFKQTGLGIPVRDTDGAAISLIRTLSEEDFAGSAPVIAEDGSLSIP